MTLITMLLIALAGAAGAVCRALIAHAVAMRLPARMTSGTWTVNLLGAFALGAVVVMAAEHHWPPTATAVLSTGFLGAFTTFSTWMYETVRLIEERAWRVAALNILAPLVIGPSVVACGAWIAAQLSAMST